MSWLKLKHLFSSDDGSLPDIFVEGLSRAELVSIYAWVRAIAPLHGEASVWDNQQNVELSLTELARSPAELLLDGIIDPFRHWLQPFAMHGVVIPQLSIYMESDSSISFDYRMGAEWQEPQLLALLRFLAAIRSIAPSCRVFQADDGGYHRPNHEFEREFNAFVAGACKVL